MKKLTILLVEDNLDDAFLIKEVMDNQELMQKMYHVLNGAEALKFLLKEKPYEEVETPDLILMDINMPIMDGHEALKKIKSTEEIKHIPVLILTTSSRKEDILKAYKEQTSSYIVKPGDVFVLDKLVESLKNYWNQIVKLPNNESN